MKKEQEGEQEAPEKTGTRDEKEAAVKPEIAVNPGAASKPKSNSQSKAAAVGKSVVDQVVPLEPKTAAELVEAAQSLAAAVATADAPVTAEDWGKKPVSESPWDVSGFKADTFAQDILSQVKKSLNLDFVFNKRRYFFLPFKSR